MKKITITIVAPAIITNPPQQEQMQLQIDGIIPLEAVHLLLSAASQIAVKELPPLIEIVKKSMIDMNPMGVTPGKA